MNTRLGAARRSRSRALSTSQLEFDELRRWMGARDRIRAVFPKVAAGTVRSAGIAPAVALDIVSVVVGVTVAHWLRLDVVSSDARAGGTGGVFWLAVAAGVISAVVLATQGSYGVRKHATRAGTSKAVLAAVSIALVISTALTGPDSDRGIRLSLLAPAWMVGSACLLTSRLFLGPWYAKLVESLRSPSRVLIVGSDTVGQDLARELGEKYQVVGYVDDRGVAAENGLAVLGPVAELDRVIEQHRVDEVIVSLPVGRREIRDTLTRGFTRRVRLSFLADVGTLLPPKFDVRLLARRPYVCFEPVAPVTWLKRASDIFLAAFAVAIFSPVFVIAAVAIKRDSPGPVFHRQTRLGMHGRPFEMLKFRSMRADAESARGLLSEHNEASGPMFKIRRDPRVTRVGRWLRRTSLDELPQIFNVLRGEMSLVGPRPPLPQEVERYESWQFGRLRIRPGMTGLWQVNGRSEIPFSQMVRLDVYYARNWSLWLDLKILLRTAPAVLSRRGAY